MEAERRYDWTITPDKVEAIRRLIAVGRPHRIILFGSYLRGRMDANSDLDLLVISRDDIQDSRRESVRLRRALRGISMAMDILVLPHGQWEQLKDQPGLIYCDINRHGKVVYESQS